MEKFYPPPDLVAVGTARAPLWIWGAGPFVMAVGRGGALTAKKRLLAAAEPPTTRGGQPGGKVRGEFVGGEGSALDCQ